MEPVVAHATNHAKERCEERAGACISQMIAKLRQGKYIPATAKRDAKGYIVFHEGLLYRLVVANDTPSLITITPVDSSDWNGALNEISKISSGKMKSINNRISNQGYQLNNHGRILKEQRLPKNLTFQQRIKWLITGRT